MCDANTQQKQPKPTSATGKKQWGFLARPGSLSCVVCCLCVAAVLKYLLCAVGIVTRAQSQQTPGHSPQSPYQGRAEVRWRPGQETSLAPPCSNLGSFASKCTVLKKVLAALGLFGAPQWFSGHLCPLCTSSVRPWALSSWLCNQTMLKDLDQSAAWRKACFW